MDEQGVTIRARPCLREEDPRTAGPVLATAMVSTAAIWSTVHHASPFHSPFDSLAEEGLSVQLFLAVLTASALVMSALYAERRRSEESLRMLNGELERRVAARSASLESANEQLLVEVAVRTRAETAARESEAAR